MINKDRLINRFLSYVKCPSESGFEREFAEMLEHEMQEMGFEVTRDEKAAQKAGSDAFNLYGFIEGADKTKSILFCCHMDTVSPGRGIEPVIENGIIKSCGNTILGADDKSGIAAVMEAVQSVFEDGLRPKINVEVLFTVCEEIGLKGAEFANYGIIKSKDAIVLDSGNRLGTMTNRSPSMLKIRAEFKGTPSHAGVSFNEGRHALRAAAMAVDTIDLGYVDNETVMNINNFIAEGPTNVVCSDASFDMEIRCFTEEGLMAHKAHVLEKIKSAALKFDVEHFVTVSRSGNFCHVPEDNPLCVRLKECFLKNGITPEFKSTFGGSDASVLFEHGINAVNCGFGMTNCHSVDEYIKEDDLLGITKIIRNIIYEN